MTAPGLRHRIGLAFYGASDETESTTLETLRSAQIQVPESVLWVSESPAPDGYISTAPNQIRTYLGASFHAVVIDIHQTFSPDVLGLCQGFVWGGGLMIFRLNAKGRPPTELAQRMVLEGYDASAVGTRTYDRFLRCIKHLPSVPLIAPATILPAIGTPEQAEIVRTLAQALRAPKPSYTCLTADRGRGKSSAMGLALKEMGQPNCRVAVTAAHDASVQEILRFAYGDDQANEKFVAAADIAYGHEDYDIILIDEAAQLPVPLLQRMVLRHPDTRFVFATTIRGYEGTGRGFSLRFLGWLDAYVRERDPEYSVLRLTLDEPIRWGLHDPVETLMFNALLLDADLAILPAENLNPTYEYRHFDRHGLAEDEPMLRDLFGLLIHAHYRTTPSDLHHLLDGPNIELHGLLLGGRVVAATMVAMEGYLGHETCLDVYWGRSRLRGHALAETLISHSARPDAGRLTMVRSVRIAVHPSLRRQGLATKLIEHVHGAYEPDLFGTLFGVTDDLLSFRRHVGYELIRVGASRGSRTGEPAAVMMRPLSPAAQALFKDLRQDLARDLPSQLQIMQAGHELEISPDLATALGHELPPAPPVNHAQIQQDVATFAFGPRTQDAVAKALIHFVRRHEHRLSALSPTDSTLISARILQDASWHEAMYAAQLPSIPATMRALKRAVRQFVKMAEPELQRLVGTYPPNSASYRSDIS